jgi:hypothetical protein
MRAWNIMKSCFKVFGSDKNAARAPKVSPQSVQRSKSGGEACSNDSKSRSFVKQSVFNRKRMNSKERTTYDRKVRISAQLPNGKVVYLGQCVLCLLWMSVATGKFRENDSKSRVLKLSKRYWVILVTRHWFTLFIGRWILSTPLGKFGNVFAYKRKKSWQPKTKNQTWGDPVRVPPSSTRSP